jgi:hypothetical protein
MDPGRAECLMEQLGQCPTSVNVSSDHGTHSIVDFGAHVKAQLGAETVLK